MDARHRDSGFGLAVAGPLLIALTIGAVAWMSISNNDQQTELRAAATRPVVDESMRIVQGTQAMIAEGKTLFAASCVGCHGDNGEGKIGIGPRINSTSFLAAASDGFLMRTISKGREGTTMIPWGAVLGEDKVKSLVAFMRSWDAVPPAELDERPLEGSVADGQQLFSDICSSCHGRTGAGYQETANGTGIGRRAFLSSASNGYLRYLVKHGKDQTQMRGFSGAKTSVANLNDTQIENVIAYLRNSAW